MDRVPTRPLLFQLALRVMAESRVSAQMVVAILLGEPLHASTEQQVFFPSYPPRHRERSLVPPRQLEEMDPESRNVFAVSIQDIYFHRPPILAHLSPFHFARFFRSSTRTVRFVDPEPAATPPPPLYASDIAVYVNHRYPEAGLPLVLREEGREEDVDRPVRVRCTGRLSHVILLQRDAPIAVAFPDPNGMAPHEAMYTLISSHVAHAAPLLTAARFTVSSVRFLHLMSMLELEEAIRLYPLAYASRLRGMIESRSDLMRDEDREAMGTTTDDIHETATDVLLTDPPINDNTMDVDYDLLLPPTTTGDPDSQLSDEQERLVRLVRRHLHGHIRPGFRVFLTGPAGTGKSRVIRAVEAACREYSEQHMGVTAMRHGGVRTCASTGAAAALLNAVTFHSLLGFNIHDDSQRQAPSAHRLATMRLDWDGVRVLIIDECSMLTLPLLHYANKRLNQIGRTHV